MILKTKKKTWKDHVQTFQSSMIYSEGDTKEIESLKKEGVNIKSNTGAI